VLLAALCGEGDERVTRLRWVNGGGGAGNDGDSWLLGMWALGGDRAATTRNVVELSERGQPATQ
jgi:hypothetical protein